MWRDKWKTPSTESLETKTHGKPFRELAKGINRQFTEEYWSNVYLVVKALKH